VFEAVGSREERFGKIAITEGLHTLRCRSERRRILGVERVRKRVTHGLGRRYRREIRWRPKCDGSENLRSTFVIDLGRERKRRKKREVRPLRIVAMFERADQWQELLDSGEVVNRAALARRFGVSAMRVTQVLALLKLDRRVREAISALPPGTPDDTCQSGVCGCC